MENWSGRAAGRYLAVPREGHEVVGCWILDAVAAGGKCSCGHS